MFTFIIKIYCFFFCKFFNYEIFNYPLDYLPCFLTLFATSNYADIKDIQEDKMNNITTIPVAIGEKNSNIEKVS